MIDPKRFTFPAETRAFLIDLRRHNTKAWFAANRARCEAGYLEPAKAFVEAVAPTLEEVVPGIAAEPRVNGSIFRINRDVRFSRDKTRTRTTSTSGSGTVNARAPSRGSSYGSRQRRSPSGPAPTAWTAAASPVSAPP
jgi:uncharacterized protein (DUF2461 family)